MKSDIAPAIWNPWKVNVKFRFVCFLFVGEVHLQKSFDDFGARRDRTYRG